MKVGSTVQGFAGDGAAGVGVGLEMELPEWGGEWPGCCEGERERWERGCLGGIRCE